MIVVPEVILRSISQNHIVVGRQMQQRSHRTVQDDDGDDDGDELR